MKIDIVTGCDSGIGNVLVSRYIEEERPVIYSFLENDPFKNNEGVFGLKLDLRSEVSIENFYKNVTDLLNEKDFEIGVLFNNAGIAMGGPVENLPLYIYREVMEINFFGLISLTQRLIPLLVKSKGKIVIHGSMAGRISLPFMSAYAASKHALEALTDCLRCELDREGIQVLLLETGGVSTPIWTKAEKQDISFIDKKYDENVTSFYKNFVKPAQASMPVGKAVDKIYKIMGKKKLPYRYRISKNPAINYIPLILPTSIKDFLFKKMISLEN